VVSISPCAVKAPSPLLSPVESGQRQLSQHGAVRACSAIARSGEGCLSAVGLKTRI